MAKSKKGESRKLSTLHFQLSTKELVRQLILLRAEAWEQGTISVTALNGYLKNLKFRFCISHN